MSGMYYYREVYQNIQYKELFYMFFDIVNEMKCEWSVNYATVFLQQWIYYNVTMWRVVSLVHLSNQKIYKLNMFCLSIIFVPNIQLQ